MLHVDRRERGADPASSQCAGIADSAHGCATGDEGGAKLADAIAHPAVLFPDRLRLRDQR